MKKAFTLIELLVVIAIIAILAAILFPVFAQAKLAAKKTNDLSNLKNLQTATLIYMADVDDRFPMLRNSTPNWGCGGQTPPLTCTQVNSGHVMLAPYVKNKPIWVAPADAMPRCDDSSTGFNAPDTGGAVSYTFTYHGLTVGRTQAYGIAGWDSVSTSTGNSSTARTESKNGTELGDVASTIWMVPSYISWTYWNGLMQHRNDQREYAFERGTGPGLLPNGLPTWPQVLAVPGVWCGAGDAMAVGAYGGVSNWAFADGHAKAMKRSQIMDPLWASDSAAAAANFAKNLIHTDERYKK